MTRQPDPLARAVLWAAFAAMAVKLVLAATTRGTEDVATWELFGRLLRKIGGAGMYRGVRPFIHPPFMLHAIAAIGWAARSTGIPFAFWLRAPGAFADFGSLFLVSRMLAERAGMSSHQLALGWLAAAPTSILISGYHGNTDPVMVFLVLLAVRWIDSPRLPWLAGAAFGMSLNIKAASLLFAPAVFLYLSGWRRRFAFLAAAALVVVAGSMPYLAQEPWRILRRVLGYGGQYGNWGLSRLAAEMPWLGIDPWLRRYGTLGSMALLVALAIWMNRGEKRPPLFRQCGLMVLAFLSATSGFGVQYLAWLVPWVVGAGVRWAAAFYATSGAYLLLMYAWMSRSPAWRSGNPAWARALWVAVLTSELLCWLTVTALFLVAMRSLRRDRNGASTRSPGVSQP